MYGHRLRAAIAGALAVLFMSAAVVFADDLFADGDGLAPVGAGGLDFGTVCVGPTTTKPVAIALKASNHPNDATNMFAGGSIVTVTIGSTSVMPGGTAAATGGTIVLPADWPTLPNGTMSETLISQATLTALLPNSNWRGAITYLATGTNLLGNPLVKGTSLNARAVINACDTTPPVLTLPGDMTVEATSPVGAVVEFTATAVDPSPGGQMPETYPPVSCSPASGSTFAFGSTLVICSAMDTYMNMSTGSFTVTVVDTTPPNVTLTGVTDGASYQLGTVPTAGCLTADSGSGVVEDATLTLSGDPASGPGTYTATCAGALDAVGNAAAPVSATFTVVALPEPTPEPTPTPAPDPTPTPVPDPTPGPNPTPGPDPTPAPTPVPTPTPAPVPTPTPVPPPDAADGVVLDPLAQTSLVERGWTVPLRFRLAGVDPAETDTSGWQIRRVNVLCAAPVVELGSSLALSHGEDGLTYNTDHYFFEADLRDQTLGTCWRLRVVLDDGSYLDSGPFRITGAKSGDDATTDKASRHENSRRIK